MSYGICCRMSILVFIMALLLSGHANAIILFGEPEYRFGYVESESESLIADSFSTYNRRQGLNQDSLTFAQLTTWSVEKAGNLVFFEMATPFFALKNLYGHDLIATGAVNATLGQGGGGSINGGLYLYSMIWEPSTGNVLSRLDYEYLFELHDTPGADYLSNEIDVNLKRFLNFGELPPVPPPSNPMQYEIKTFIGLYYDYENALIQLDLFGDYTLLTEGDDIVKSGAGLDSRVGQFITFIIPSPPTFLLLSLGIVILGWTRLRRGNSCFVLRV